ncbi:MBL fold metallo-hydrolase [Haloactinomyces albus]|uniref:Glyoxylase-like metal-dependent hydrolase (Beta-lactamase superfamily II) n=1 Tax=Haloactinomyces albus TaxID=1352928 RepID=A0AAE3ZC80_9ACTN|nr:MBL fold metallo-hydrolase [Haloactinomyces albus]MDR7302253.1 glyoxylase-like metal-dependent hydrolase (beta-lactamase superfamily II) [Haloactinomyces albus]
MRVHHLNCGTMRPLGGSLIAGSGSILSRATMVCHCLLIETNSGLVLVDTGIGLPDIDNPSGTLGPDFRLITHPVLDRAETAVSQVTALGYEPDDVRHIVLTHLDVDHAGGLRDFPHATVHVHQEELRASKSQHTRQERMRYRPAQWGHRPHWMTYPETAGESWFGFGAVRDLSGLPSEILLIPLAGHSRGHTGVAVHDGNRWLLHAGDAFFLHSEIDPDRPRCTPGLRAFQTLVQADRDRRLSNQRRLRALARDHAHEVDIFCSHDAEALREHQATG